MVGVCRGELLAAGAAFDPRAGARAGAAGHVERRGTGGRLGAAVPGGGGAAGGVLPGAAPARGTVLALGARARLRLRTRIRTCIRARPEAPVRAEADALDGPAVAAEAAQPARPAAGREAGPRAARPEHRRAGRRGDERYEGQQGERGREGQWLVRGEEAGGVAVEGEAGQVAAKVEEEEQGDHRAERAGHCRGDRREDRQTGGAEAERRQPLPGTGGRVGPGDRHRELHGRGERRDAPGQPQHGRAGRVRVSHRVPQGAQEQEARARRRRRDQESAELDGGAGPAR